MTAPHGSSHFVVEIDVAGRIHEIDEVFDVAVVVEHGHCLRFDSDAALLFHFELIEVLRGRVPWDCISDLEEAVGKSRLAVVDMSNDAEVAYAFDRKPLAKPEP